MTKKLTGLAAAAAFLIAPAAALATGFAPGSPGPLVIDSKTKTTFVTHAYPAIDPDRDWRYNEFQINGVFSGYGTFDDTTGTTPYTFTGLQCGHGYTIRVRAIDFQGNKSGFVSITGSQGAVTLPC